MEDYQNQDLEVHLQKVGIQINGYRWILEKPVKQAMWDFNQNHRMHYKPFHVTIAILVSILILSFAYYVCCPMLIKIANHCALSDSEARTVVFTIIGLCIFFLLALFCTPVYFRSRRRMIIDDQMDQAAISHKTERDRYLYYRKLVQPIIDDLEKIDSITDRYCGGGKKNE